MQVPDYEDLRALLPRSSANAAKWLEKRARGNVQNWVIHWPGAPVVPHTKSAEIAQLKAWALQHIAKDWSVDGKRGVHGWTIMYHWAVGQSGTLYWLNDVEDILWHCCDGNAVSAATLVIVPNGGEMTPLQQEALNAHIEYQEWLGYCAASQGTTFGHGECGGMWGGGPEFGNQTECPGAGLVEWCRARREAATEPVSTAERRWFPETHRSVAYGFKAAWEALEAVQMPDGFGSVAMRLVGYPISEEMHQRIGDWEGTVQYFERARAEWHVENGYGQVMWGRVGEEAYANLSAVRSIGAQT